MAIDYSDAVGWPAEPTPVRTDDTRLFPALWNKEDREWRIHASRKWKAANREHVLVSDRERKRRARAR